MSSLSRTIKRNIKHTSQVKAIKMGRIRCPKCAKKFSGMKGNKVRCTCGFQGVLK